MQQAQTRVKEPLPNTARLAATEWRVVLTKGEYTRFGKSCKAVTFKPDNLGYARRNKFQPDYIQVVCPTTKGSIGSWHIHETEADLLLHVARVAPDQDSPQRTWKAGWAQSF